MWNYFSRKTVMDHDSSQSRQYYQTYLQVATQKKKVKTTSNKNSWFVTRHLFSSVGLFTKRDLDDDPLPYKKNSLNESPNYLF